MSRVHEWPVSLDAPALQGRWRDLFGRFDARSDVVDAGWQHVERAYSDPGRHYHTLEHLGEVLALIDALGGNSLSPAVELAAWLHDLVYDTGRTDSEAESASWAVEHLPALGVDLAIVQKVHDLILMTTTHDPLDTDEQATTLSDADLAILGAPSQRYQRYAADVRAEYAAFSDASWRNGRSRVLDTLLARPRLYHHQGLRAWEAQAHRNMSSELAALRGSAP